MEGVNNIIEILRLDLRESIEVAAPLSEDVFKGKEVEWILKEDLEGGKEFVRNLTNLLKQYLPTAIVNEVQATQTQDFESLKAEIGDKIDDFVQKVKQGVEGVLQQRASGSPAAATDPQQSAPSVDPTFGMGSTQGMMGSNASPQMGAFAQPNPDLSGEDPTGGPQAQGKKGPGFWQGMKNLWRNIVWNPLKKAWTTGPNESVQALVGLLTESNDDILASIDTWGNELKQYVVKTLPSIAQQGSMMSPEELAGLVGASDEEAPESPMSSQDPTDPTDPTMPAVDPAADAQQQSPPSQTLPIDTQDDGQFVDDQGATGDMSQGLPTNTPNEPEAPASNDSGTKRGQLPKAKKAVDQLLSQENPQFPAMKNKEKTLYMLRKVFDKLGMPFTKSGAIDAINGIGQRLSKFDIWHNAAGRKQNDTLGVEPYKLVAGSWARNRDVVYQLANYILVNGESLPEAIDDVAQDMPEDPMPKDGALTGSGPPTMDDAQASAEETPSPDDVAGGQQEAPAGPQDVQTQEKPPVGETLPAKETGAEPTDAENPMDTAQRVLDTLQKRHPTEMAEMGDPEELKNAFVQEIQNGKSDQDVISMMMNYMGVGMDSGETSPTEPEPTAPASPTEPEPTAPAADLDGEENPFDVAEPTPKSKPTSDDYEVVHHKGGASIGPEDHELEDDPDSPWSEPSDEESEEELQRRRIEDEDAAELAKSGFVPVGDEENEKSPEEAERVAQDIAAGEELRQKVRDIEPDHDMPFGGGGSSNLGWEIDSKPNAANIKRATGQIMKELERDHDVSGIKDLKSKVSEIIKNNWDASYAYGAPLDGDTVMDYLREMEASAGGDDESYGFDDDEGPDRWEDEPDDEDIRTNRDGYGESTRRLHQKVYTERLNDLRKKVFAD